MLNILIKEVVKKKVLAEEPHLVKTVFKVY